MDTKPRDPGPNESQTRLEAASEGWDSLLGDDEAAPAGGDGAPTPPAPKPAFAPPPRKPTSKAGEEGPASSPAGPESSDDGPPSASGSGKAASASGSGKMASASTSSGRLGPIKPLPKPQVARDQDGLLPLPPGVKPSESAVGLPKLDPGESAGSTTRGYVSAAASALAEFPKDGEGDGAGDDDDAGDSGEGSAAADSGPELASAGSTVSDGAGTDGDPSTGDGPPDRDGAADRVVGGEAALDEDVGGDADAGSASESADAGGDAELPTAKSPSDARPADLGRTEVPAPLTPAAAGSSGGRLGAGLIGFVVGAACVGLAWSMAGSDAETGADPERPTRAAAVEPEPEPAVPPVGPAELPEAPQEVPALEAGTASATGTGGGAAVGEGTDTSAGAASEGTGGNVAGDAPGAADAVTGEGGGLAELVGSGDPRAVPPGTDPKAAAAFENIPVLDTDGPPVGGIGKTGVHVDRLAVGDPDGPRECQELRTRFTLEDGRVNLCLRVVHPRKKERVAVRWVRDGETMRRSLVHVPGAHAYRSRVFLTLKDGYEGNWTAVVESYERTVLGEIDFVVEPAP